MSKIDEIINRLCPRGVGYQPLSEVVDYCDGFPFSAGNFLSTGRYNVVRISDIASGAVSLSDKFIDVLPLKLKKGQILSGGEVLVGMSGSTGKVGYNSLKDVVVNQRIAILRNRSTILNGFLKHLLVNSNFTEYCFANGTGPQNNISKFALLAYKIPVPPIEVQREIVRILDNFTELTAELTAELTVRKKQYEYYRDTLILGQDVECKTLGEIATELYRGAGIKRDEVTQDGIQCVRYGEIYTTYDIWFDKCVSHTNEEKIASKKYFESGDILFAITGESVEEIAKSCAYVGNDKCLAGGDIVVMKHKQNPKYLAYALSTTEAQRQKSYGKIKSKVVHASVPSISSISIPLPSLDEQARIADILDKFHSLVTDISQGLPAEIEARKKQYEYYRDRLLAFKEKAI